MRELVRNVDGLPRAAGGVLSDAIRSSSAASWRRARARSGRALAARLGVPFVDTDAEIERATGRRIARALARRGRGGVPRARARAGRALCSATGAARHRLRRRHASPIDAHAAPRDRPRRSSSRSRRRPRRSRARVRRPGDAPEPRASAATRSRARASSLDARAEAYAECHLTLATDALDPDAVADAVVALAERDPLLVPLGLAQLRDRRRASTRPALLTDAIARCAPSSVVVVTDSNVQRARGAAIDAALRPLASVHRVTLAARRVAQDARHASATIWDAALGAGVDRDAVVRRGRRRRRRRPRGLRGGVPASRRALRPGADHAARDGRRLGRRQDGLRSPDGQEPRRRVPPAERRRGRPRAPRRRCPRASAPPGWPRS